MTTVTWGSGGAHATLKAAYNSHTWTDDLLLQQAGTSTEGATQLDFKNQAGHDVVILGNGVLCDFSAFYFRHGNATAVNGNVTIRGLNVTHSASNFIQILGSTTGYTSKGYISVSEIKINTSTYTDIVDFASPSVNYTSTISSVSLYQCMISSSWPSNNNSALTCSGSNMTMPNVYIENIITPGMIWIINSAPLNAGKFIHIKNTYTNTDGSTTYFAANVQSIDSSFFRSTANNTNSNENIDLSTDNFVSIQGEDYGYLVPKNTSTLYTLADQTSNIAGNVSGLNGVSVTNRVAGCMASPLQVSPPSSIVATHTQNGIVVTWSDVVQTGYESTYLYWETVNADSAFITPKAEVLQGVGTYLIPYSELTSSSLWYLRLVHGVPS